MSIITAQQERLQGDLRGLIEGEVRCDEVALRLYSTDAGLFECRPLGIVYPRNRGDVVAAVRYASEHGLSIHARGAGTGRAGACLGHGLVLDFTKYMRRIVQISDDSVTLQPGATLDRVNGQLTHSQGQIVGPDPGFSPATTIGSMLAVDGAGAHWLSRGFPHDTVRKLQVVLADGEIVTFERPGDSTAIPKASPENEALSGQISRELAKYLAMPSVSKSVAKQSEIRDCGMPGRFGYRVCDTLRPNAQIDLMPLLLGSEGTLGIITQAELDTIPAPRSSCIALFLFDLLDNAMQAVPIIRAHRPATCELIDRRRITLLRDWDARFKSVLPLDAEAVLAVEFEGENHLTVGDRMHDLVNEIRYDRQLCYTTRVAFQADDLALFRALVAKSQFALYRMPHYLSGISRFEDTVVPIERLSTYIVAVQNLFKRHELAPSFFGHVGQGQVSVQPVLNLSSDDALARIRRVIPEFYDEVIKQGGSICSEQAYGWARSSFVPLQHAGYYQIYEQVKKLFDPKGLLNPGKIVAHHDTPPLEYRSPIVSLRKLADVALYDQRNDNPSQTEKPDATETLSNGPVGEPLQRQLEVQLKWEPAAIRETTMRCNGCGVCRSRMSDTRMCPVFRRDMNEEAAPRAKANLMRGIIDGQSDLALLTAESSKTVADYCVHCHMCRLDCPAEVDMPKIAFQSKCAFAAAHGLSLSDRFFSHLDQILKFLALVSCPVNWSVTNRWTRWLYEKLFGLSQARKLPKLAKISYLARAIWYKRLSKPSRRRDRKVALFVDLYANHFETRIADAAVKVLEHNGIDVYVPGRQQASGAFSISCGNRDRAEKLSRKNISLLADVIRQGYHVVTLEPTSAICLKEEYAYMSDDADAALVAANTSDVMTYLHQMHLEGKFQLDFSPITTMVGYHAPCRSLMLGRRNLAEPTVAEQLLRLVPGLAVKRLEHGCCGLAGSFGMQAKNFRMSLRIGMPLFSALRDTAIQLGTTECSLCKMQMEQGGNKRVLHPIVILAHAYGFLPEIEPLLTVSSKAGM